MVLQPLGGWRLTQQAKDVGTEKRAFIQTEGQLGCRPALGLRACPGAPALQLRKQ